MRKIFQKYAQYYDNLYREKEYHKECRFLNKIFHKFQKRKVSTILDLGCGTGSHDIILAKEGYHITGLDFSSQMLKIARGKARKAKLKIDFYQQDLRKAHLKRNYDAVISLFAVMGYQIKNSDFEQALLTAHKHLHKKGLFIFDIWFGPAVLADKPQNRIKIIKLNSGKLIRETNIIFNMLKQNVQIDFHTKLILGNRTRDNDNERHLMRFFFPQEIEYFLSRCGFQLLKICPFMSLAREPTEKDWEIIVISRKR